MKTIILAAGYATRLYPLTENFPKPLLEVGGSTLLDRMLADLDAIADICEHIIVSNHKFMPVFERWAAESCYVKPLRLVDDGSLTNETRIGAVNDLILALDQLQIDDDVLVAAADNVLEFSFRGFVDYFHQKQTSLIMCHHEPSIPALQKTGVVCLDADHKVLLMEEKPREPKTHWAVPPFYLYRRSDLPLIRSAIADGCGYDAPGNLAHYLTTRTTLHAWPMTGARHDIGDLASYERVKALFRP
ncbi:MAG: nucleotidyltransferase family protein [Prevotellaceae bacterium]|jgi:glucose-1-phosphate thymidylyltransferase|nr:nucleotidyltransferase family protein [Prevotellaceae bacterium]